MAQKFHLGAVLSVTTGRLVAIDGIGDCYKILDFMASDNLYTHQLPRVQKECAPWLLRQFPQLANADLAALDAWFESQEYVQANEAYDASEEAWRAAATRYHASGRIQETRDEMHALAKVQDHERERRKTITERLVKLWLDDQIARCGGEWFDVEPIPADDHARRDAVQELKEMKGEENVLVFDVQDE